jgi:type II secretory pathway pseudopilin PulG
MTLGEVMIASSVLLVCLTSLAGVLGMSVNSSRMARARDEAANLANAKIEYARSLAYDDVGLHYSNGVYGDPAGEIPAQETTGGFTVTTECTWVRNDVGRAAYKKLVVHVAWQEPVAGEVAVTTMIYGKSDIVTSGDLSVRLRYRESPDPVINGTVAIVTSTNSARSVLSDSSGEAFFGQVALGPATMTVVPPAGWVVDTSSIPSVTVTADRVAVIIVYVQRPVQATIHVATASGTAVAGASVTLRRADGVVLPVVLSDASGNALVTGLLYADYTASVAKSGYSSGVAPFTAAVGTDAQVVPVAVNPLLGVGLTVRTSDANDTAIAGANVTVSSTPVQSGTTGSNGEVSFTGLSEGSYTVTASKSGYVPQTTTSYMHDGDQARLVFHLVPVVTQGNMSIVTLDKNGHAGSIRVIVAGPNGYYRNDLYSGNDGTLSLQGLVPGSYQVQCYTKPASVVTTLVTAGQTALVQVSQKK